MRQLEMESRAATARAALATAAVHVAHAEERSAALEQVAADTSEQVLRACELASETDRRVTEKAEEEIRREKEAQVCVYRAFGF